MKLNYYLTMALCIFGVVTFCSCSDDNDGPSADVNISIVGDWQIAGEDLNGDGAIQGIVVHEDGTVTEWMHTQSELNPYQFGFKTGKWSVNGNHYEMQLPKGASDYYQVTVAGNNDSLMYLAYNGKTSVVPFHRLAKLPGDGDATLRLLESLKMSNFTMSDLTGYWALTGDDGTVDDSGIYIDTEGNVSKVDGNTYTSTSIQRSIQYHSGKVTLSAYLCTIADYVLYGVNGTIMLVKENGGTLRRLVRRDVPQEIKHAEEIATSKVPDWLTGTWESVHYKKVYGSVISEDFDINESEWTRQFYRELTFSSDHQLRQTENHGYNVTLVFYVNDGTVYTAESLNDLINNPTDANTGNWTIVSHSADELTIKQSWTGGYEIYTYKRK